MSPTVARVRDRTGSLRAHRRFDRFSKPVEAPQAPIGSGAERPALRLLTPELSTILIAGSDEVERAALAKELAEELPASTRFDQAHATSELLERAPASRLVMLSGDLDGMSAESTVQLLGRRHPTLPVLALKARRTTPGSLDGMPRMRSAQPGASLTRV